MLHRDRSIIRSRSIGRTPLFVWAWRRRVSPLLEVDLDAPDFMEIISIC